MSPPCTLPIQQANVIQNHVACATYVCIRHAPQIQSGFLSAAYTGELSTEYHHTSRQKCAGIQVRHMCYSCYYRSGEAGDKQCPMGTRKPLSRILGLFCSGALEVGTAADFASRRYFRGFDQLVLEEPVTTASPVSHACRSMQICWSIVTT